jgi:SAM-dependent methyltransferase
MRVMTADPRVYLSERLAHRYAHHRPPVHAAIWARIAAANLPDFKVASALDIGCGAGASTAALQSHAEHVTGIDPSPEMLREAERALPTATFILGRAEALPVASQSHALVAAAGSLNYSDPATVLREVARVLVAEGRFVAYDFSTGRVDRKAARVEACFDRFRKRFAPLPGYAIDLKQLPYAACGLKLLGYDAFELSVAMSAAAYVEYLMGETNVEAALAAGLDEAEARRFCADAFDPLFEGEVRTVRFTAVVAVAGKETTLPSTTTQSPPPTR